MIKLKTAILGTVLMTALSACSSPESTKVFNDIASSTGGLVQIWSYDRMSDLNESMIQRALATQRDQYRRIDADNYCADFCFIRVDVSRVRYDRNGVANSIDLSIRNRIEYKSYTSRSERRTYVRSNGKWIIQSRR